MRIQINRTTRRIAGVLLLLLLSVTSYGATAGNIEGTWHGTLKLNAMKLSIVMHFSDNACTLDSPDQGAKGIKGEVREITAEKVDVAFPTLNATYTGVLKDGKIEGTFTQMGYKLPLVLEEGQPVRIRPQTPQPPFPYQTEEVSFVNTEDSASLAGTLTYPVGYNSKRKVPVVIMVTGSGLQNRDEELFEHKPFLVIADFLAGDMTRLAPADGDAEAPRPEGRDPVAGPVHHEMHVQGELGMGPHGLAHGGAEGDVGHEVTVHHIEVDPIRAVCFQHPNVLAHAGEVGG